MLGDARFSRSAIASPGGPRQQIPSVPPDAFNGMELLRRTGEAKAVLQHLRPRRIAVHRPWLESLAEGLLEAMIRRGAPGNLVADYAAPLPLAVMCRVLGLETGRNGLPPYADEEHLTYWSDVAFSMNSRDPREIAASWAGLRGYLAQAVARERRHPGDGLLTTLVAAHEQRGSFSEDELLDVAAGLLVVGYKTLISFLALAAVALLRHPEQARRTAQDPARLLPAAVEELLRYVLIENRGVARIATERVRIGGVTVAAGELVVVALHAADHDPAAFPRPGRLEVTRRDAEHLAFGHGEHYCPGAALARLQIHCALAALLPRLSGLRLAVPAERLSWRDGLILRTPEAVPVTW
ncbi:cytochrome P450 [Streptomyces sp. MST-110588]|uniref:cytochrome P450 n=1 Tax=Streptomyces sp. MST-110588 TaxID=2833628 RepID=UPI001F5DAB49|nr:cytochrome P450 [Streptomyces sp. MST-110588]UNO43345.1 cytochrome P450 [Streptomyces sp. MST-110588]